MARAFFAADSERGRGGRGVWGEFRRSEKEFCQDFLDVMGYNYIMANEQLLNYIKQARQSGKNNEQIRQELINTGWKGNDVDEALKVNPPISKSFKFPVLALAIVGVAIVGYFASAYYFTLWPFEVSVAPVPTFTPRPSTAVKVEDTSNWKVYRNQEYGFEFKYPNDWNLKENKEYFNGKLTTEVLLSTNFDDLAPIIQFFITPNVNTTNSENIEPYGEWTTIISKESVIIAGIKTNRYVTSGPDAPNHTEISLVKNNNLFSIDTNIRDADLLKNVFDKILSTFKFIEPVDTSTWKTYTNTKYGFEFKYPEDWEIKESTWSDTSYVVEIEDKNHSFYIDIAGTVTPGFTVRVLKDDFGGNIDNFIINEKIDLSNVTEKKQTVVSGISGYSVKSETPPAAYDFIAIFYRGYVYQIMYGGSGYKADLEQNLKNTFEVFLPTFKFK